MRYFAQLPLIAYKDLQGSENYVGLTNILTRSGFLQDIVGNTSLFYEYQVKNGETPEIIAEKLYGSVTRFWIVLLFNKLSNPYYDFPISNEELEEYIEKKYGFDSTQSRTEIHHYEVRVLTTVLLNGVSQESYEDVYWKSDKIKNPSTGLAITDPQLPGTADTSIDVETTTETFSNGISVTKKYTNHAISVYTYETNENEKRRTIKLLDKNYVATVEAEFKRLMTNG